MTIKSNPKILMFGGTGLLGTELGKIYTNIVRLNRFAVNITSDYSVKKVIDDTKPDIIINAAAFTDSTKVNANKDEVIDVNMIGAGIIARNSRNCRLIYISTDYIYDGTRSDLHSEEDVIRPENMYAWSKLAGEIGTKFNTDHAIIRTSFGATEFPHTAAYNNLIVSKDYVDVIAPMIMNVVHSSYMGVINVGTSAKSMYDYAIERNKNVQKSSLASFKNFSLNTYKYEQLCRNR